MASDSAIVSRHLTEVLEQIAEGFHVKREGDPYALQLACFHAIYEVCRQGDWQRLELYEVRIAFLKNRQGQSLLLHAVEEGDATIVKALLERGISLLETDKEGRNPLHLAALNGQCALIEELLKFYSIHSTMRCNFTVLHEAVLGDQPEAVRVLSQHRASKKVIGFYGSLELSPPALAIYLGLKACFDAFSLDQIDFAEPTLYGNWLHLALATRRFKMFSHLINHYDVRALLKQRNLDGETPLQLFENRLDATKPSLAMAKKFMLLGKAYARLESMEMFINYTLEGLQMRASLTSDPLELAKIHFRMGHALKRAERQEEALTHFVKALKIRRKRLGYNHSLVGYTWNCVGASLYHLGKYQETADCFIMAFHIEQHQTYLWNLLSVLRYMDAASIAPIQEALLPLCVSSLGKNHPQVVAFQKLGSKVEQPAGCCTIM